MKTTSLNRAHAIAAAILLMILIVTVVGLLSRRKGMWKPSEKWHRWNESYSPEADEPEPPKYEFVEE